ncbi:sodium/hydrogen exchanger 1-like isoform X1 [Wolffia australiana]
MESHLAKVFNGIVGGISLEVASVTIFVALLCFCILIGHLIGENRWTNESTVTLLLGLCAGFLTLVVTKWRNSRLLSFDEELFFIYLIPPIIFNAGFQVEKKQFFQNFSVIFLFGAAGTVISFCFISGGVYLLFKLMGVTSFGIRQFLAIGAIFSATDSVCTLQVLNQDETPLLYSLVFGEGVVNDATSIVLFNSVQKLDLESFGALSALQLLWTFLYLFITSTALGVATGLFSAFIMKKLYFGRFTWMPYPHDVYLNAFFPVFNFWGKNSLNLHSATREIAIMSLMAYFSYMLAQMCSLSGILAIFFCGVVMSHYTWHNVTEGSRTTTRHAFATASFVAETFIFLYVGMDALDIDKWKQSNGSVHTTLVVSGALLVLIMVGRAAFVFPLANFANCFRSRAKISFSQQFIIWWAGIIRGAVTIALSYEQFSAARQSSSDGAFLITNSIIVVLFTTMVFGSVTSPLIRANLFSNSSNVPASEMDPSSLEEAQVSFLENIGDDEDGSISMGFILMHPMSAIRYLWRRFDHRFMRPLFGGYGSTQ